MEKRALTIDLLRGVAIIGMVLSGQILWNAELPAWMFHAQVPPPEFRFDPTVPGITWVDLVFPFFLFSMGAAFPLALRKRLDARRESTGRVVGTILRRWALLVVFAIALANLAVEGTGIPMWGAALVRLAGWGCFCLLFMRFERLSKGQNRRVCLAGIVLLAALLAACRCVWGAPVTVERSNIIILVLANMALFGSLVWLFTRDRLPLRLALLALLVALRLGSSVEGSWNEALWNASPLPWLFQIDFLKYLCIIIPGTQQIYLDAIREGLAETFILAGAIFSMPTCGPCLGGHMGVLGKGERAVSTTNRNFVGRMGHIESEIYLASPAVAAASAVTGYLTDPAKLN